VEYLVAVRTALDRAAARPVGDPPPVESLALQEVWGDDTTSQAEELAEALGGHAIYAEPSYPAVPVPPRSPDDEDVTLGVALVSR